MDRLRASSWRLPRPFHVWQTAVCFQQHHSIILFRGRSRDPIRQAARPKETSPLSLATVRDHVFYEEPGRPRLALFYVFAPSNPFIPVKNYATPSCRDLFS